jgi:hypothetical protein
MKDTNPVSPPSIESTSPQARSKDTTAHVPNGRDPDAYIREEGEQQRIWAEHFNHSPCSIEQFLTAYVPSSAPPYVMPTHASFEDVHLNSVEDEGEMYGPFILVCLALSTRRLQSTEIEECIGDGLKSTRG